MCEKPIARTLDDARRIVKAAEAAAGLLMVGQVSRYEPDHAAAKALVDRGQIGRRPHGRRTRRPRRCRGGARPAGWPTPAKSGGPLIDQAVHSFDYCGWVTGSPAVRVTAVAADSAAGPATYCLATVRYAERHHRAGGGQLGAPADPRIQARRRARRHRGSADLGLRPPDGRRRCTRAPASPSGSTSLGDRGFTAELRRSPTRSAPAARRRSRREQAMESLRTALGALESVRTGQTDRPDDLGDRVSELGRPLGVAVLGAAHTSHAWSYAGP